VNQINHIFFDLDRTLWDYDTNSTETLTDLFNEHVARLCNARVSTFIRIFYFENQQLWTAFTASKIDKEYLRKHRFLNTLRRIGIRDHKLASTLEDAYLEKTPSKIKLIDGAHELLESLKKEKYSLHIITNGFEEVQQFKLRNCGLHSYFDAIITSDSCGFRKPDERIFNFALQKAGALANESMMVGDDVEVDILTPLALGWRTCHFKPIAHNSSQLDIKNPGEINHLSGLIELLTIQIN
jgi:putative hydrolase of the HAD superfamily